MKFFPSLNALYNLLPLLLSRMWTPEGEEVWSVLFTVTSQKPIQGLEYSRSSYCFHFRDEQLSLKEVKELAQCHASRKGKKLNFEGKSVQFISLMLFTDFPTDFSKLAIPWQKIYSACILPSLLELSVIFKPEFVFILVKKKI